MFSNPERPAHRHLARYQTGLLVITVGAALAACTTPPFCPSVDEAASHAAAEPVLVVSPPQTTEASCPAAAPTTNATTTMLAYAQQVSAMSTAELTQEIARLGDAAGPVEKLQLSLVLSQLHQLPELLRAQELLGRVLASSAPQAQPLHALASLLAARYAEQRRLNELLEKQTQQTREVQRRLDQTNERLSALKAIERSLTNRPVPPALPASANRPSHIPAP
jgi:hypothetical protein